ncbi:Leucine-rich repeat-containing protein [Cynara cardunculus var. scolymus]|uniref:Leucine-rich repeat-containing protein n=1 Tax=Cynara cardunculus var. scolymus TaxID=59895 RepID=A0A103YFT3_CYNCS|nr:Leucine-rich repeat-containing protein [Cynara cardunculus var. scolymus]
MGFLQLFIFTVLANSFAINADQSLNLNDEVLGLIVFKSYLTDPSSHLSSWNQDDDTPCSWRFITCNPATGRVTGLSLDGLNLSGKIGRGLEKLQNLKVLSLARNNFTGNLNPELSLLTNLQRLNLSRNGFSDRIPGSLMNSGSIKFLDLSENSLSGPVTEELFVKCLSLRMLSLSGNNLEGPIPNSLLKCTSLNHLNLSNNRFSGNPINSGLWSLTRIRTMDLSRNMFSGSLPNGIFALHDLKELSLEGNHFTGALPSGIGLCPHLNKLDLSNNLFTEAIPEFQALSSLNYLNLANNILTGEFPQWIGSLTSLEYLDFSGNDLTGTLPESMGDLRSLSYVSLSDNRLSGSIPLSLVSSSKLSVIRLRGNKFNGSIPDGLFELGLDLVDFSRNELTGSIPPGSSRLFENLQSLDLSANRLTGDIPAEIGLNSRLRYLNLSWNNFETKMPPELGYFQNLTVLDLRNGAFHGSVSHNSLSGSIPRSMSLLKKLKILKLEYNQLSGEIPPELGGLENLLSVNISYNRLQGRLPTGGIFQSLQQSSLEGNLGICSPLLKGPCKMNVPKPLVLDPFAYGNENGRHQGGRGGEGADQSSRSLRHHRFLSVSAIIAILAAIMISIGVLVISLLNISARRRLAFVDNAIESCSSSSRSGPSLSMGRLVWFDSKTDPNWVVSPESFLKKAAEIGEGVFGSVYKASLGEENGSDNILAIKNLVVSNMIQYPEDFDREVRVLGRVRHPNLVSLKGYYWTPKLQLLVTDYVPNGSLQTKLHDRPPSSPPLSWPNRFKILLGTAKGLAHLHHFFRPPIVHYNIKPNNILLDDNLNAKISDFGLTRLVSKLDKHVMSNRFQSALGYVAPELACQSLRVNEKCDVYGFGVLILEIVTGRRPIEYGEDNVLILNEQVKVMLEEGSVLQCVDESMGEYPEEEVLPVLKLALVCTSQIPSSRPSMAEIVQILQVIKTPIPQPF